MATTKRLNRYQVMIILLIGAFLLFSAWSARRAGTYGSRVTDRDYYSKGLRYNQTLLEQKAASVLGWRATSSLDGRRLTILLDSGREPVAAASGTLYLYRSDTPAPRRLALEETVPGRYSLLLPPELEGEYRVLVEFEREGALLSRQLLINL